VKEKYIYFVETKGHTKAKSRGALPKQKSVYLLCPFGVYSALRMHNCVWYGPIMGKGSRTMEKKNNEKNESHPSLCRERTKRIKMYRELKRINLVFSAFVCSRCDNYIYVYIYIYIGPSRSTYIPKFHDSIF